MRSGPRTPKASQPYPKGVMSSGPFKKKNGLRNMQGQKGTTNAHSKTLPLLFDLIACCWLAGALINCSALVIVTHLVTTELKQRRTLRGFAAARNAIICCRWLLFASSWFRTTAVAAHHYFLNLLRLLSDVFYPITRSMLNQTSTARRGNPFVS